MNKFELGRVVATPGLLEALEQTGETPQELLARHARLEQGELDADDHQSNQMAVKDGSRILSSFRLKNKEKVWVITEAKGDNGRRESTCLLLPSEY